MSLKRYLGCKCGERLRCRRHRWRQVGENKVMSGIQFVTDERGRKVAVQIDLKRHGAVLEDFWDGLISESRRKEKGIPLDKIKADLVKRGRLRE